MKSTNIASVIIPNWNGKHLLKECLDSLQKQTFKQFETIVVDNGSSDGSVEFLAKEHPEVRTVLLPKNLGFSTAINRGVEQSDAKYVVFLNNDTLADKNWLSELVKSAQSHPSAFSIGSRLMNYYQRDIFDGLGIRINEVGQAQSVGWQERDTGQYDHEFPVFGVTGGAALFNRELFIKVGQLDENYFMYSEEVDLAFRAQFQGYQSFYCPNAIIYHKHKASSHKKPQHLEYWQFKNMMQTIIKDFPTSVLLHRWRWLKICLVYLNTHLYQIKHGYWWPPFATDWWLLTHLPHLLAKRAAIQRSKKVPDRNIEQYLYPKKITFWGITK